MKTIQFTLIILSSLLFIRCAEEKKLLRKASNAVNASEFEEALSYYDKLLAKDSTNFYGNAGKGIVLSEYMERYDKAIPYLERAIKKSPAETSVKINSDLGQSYHYMGNYPRALYFYGKVTGVNEVGNPDYDMFLSKRIRDCMFALDHPGVAPPTEQSVKNVGNVINTSMPDYGPIYKDGKLIFTSKRKDTPKEKKNGIDGRYFESIYVSKESNGVFSAPRRFTLPDYGDDSKFKRGNESSVSVSPDGKILYVFRKGKLYEANLEDSTLSDKKMSGNVNIAGFQSFASISTDGKVLFFSSESKKGLGGLDIYKSIKNGNGKWSDPELLSAKVNTDYNEDSPFITEDGTLFFSSDGLPGYGGYDVYKTRMVNGEWTIPENLGQPINTPADDIYFVMNPNSSEGFYSSNRAGGMGDMDIYHVHYVSRDEPKCETSDSLFVINAKQDPNNDYSYSFSLNIPEQYKGNVKSISWKINNESLSESSEKFEYAFANAGTYTVFAKALVYCQTCPGIIAKCTEKEIEVGQIIVAVKPDKVKIENISPVITVIGELNNDQLVYMGWNTSPGHFDFNKYELRIEDKKILDHNITVLKTNRDLSLVINGYADCRGSDDYNNALSYKRANSVKEYLIQNGISKGRITAINAYGETRITNGCVDGAECTEAQHEENRKVDFKVSNNNKSITSVSVNQ